MHDLDELRKMRAEVPPPAPSRLAAGRTHLLVSIARPSRTPRSRRWVIVPAGVAATAALAAAVVAFVPAHRSPDVPLVGAPAATASAPRLTLAAEVLTSASATVSGLPASPVDSSQWLYTKSVSYTYGQGTTTDENWIRFDGSQESAYFESGKILVHNAPSGDSSGGTALDRYEANTTPLTACAALASLPSDPQELLATIDKRAANDDATQGMWTYLPQQGHQRTKGQKEFDYLSQLLWNAYVGAAPAGQAAAYRAIATIPDVSVQKGITNVVGHAAIGISADGGATQLLLDPHTYQVIGMRQVSIGVNPAGDKGDWPKKGAVAASLAWGQVTKVSGPGRR